MTTVQPSYQSPAPPQAATVHDSLSLQIKKTLNAVRIGIVNKFNAGDASHGPTVDVSIAQLQVTSIDPTGVRTLAPYPDILAVPVYFPNGGGFTLTFPVKKGDECILLFNDRELANWMLQGSGQAPTLPNLHDLTDAIALVGLRSNPRAIGPISEVSTQLRNDSGTTFIEVDNADNINLKAAGDLTAIVDEAEITANTVTMTVATVHMTGNLQVDGTIQANGNITGNSISLDTHVHSGVQSGSSDTGPPV